MKCSWLVLTKNGVAGLYDVEFSSRALATSGASLSAQAVQDFARGEAVGNEARFRLEVADGGAAPGAEPAVRLAHVEAAARQPLLQLEPFLAGERALLARPGLGERLAAAQPVGEMPDGERIGLGRVVFHDDAEIVEHEEPGAARAGRHQQIGAIG